MRGTIKALQPSFGFIAAEAGPDVFFHASTVVGAVAFLELNQVDGVEFEMLQPPPEKGPRARIVRCVQRAA